MLWDDRAVKTITSSAEECGPVNAEKVQAAVRTTLAGWSSLMEQAIIERLAQDRAPDQAAPVYFLVCPERQSIWLPEGEEPLLPKGVALSGVAPSDWAAIDWDAFDPLAVVNREVLAWLADRWAAACGPERFGPAFAYHADPMGYRSDQPPREPLYDLARKAWVREELPLRSASQPGDSIPF
jgi:hypothetical protein